MHSFYEWRNSVFIKWRRSPKLLCAQVQFFIHYSSKVPTTARKCLRTTNRVTQRYSLYSNFKINKQNKASCSTLLFSFAVPPNILDYPTSTDMVVREGGNVSMQCAASGFPAPNITWRKEGGEAIAVSPVSNGESLST